MKECVLSVFCEVLSILPPEFAGHIAAIQLAVCLAWHVVCLVITRQSTMCFTNWFLTHVLAGRTQLNFPSLLLSSPDTWKCPRTPYVSTNSRTKAKTPMWVFMGSWWGFICDQSLSSTSFTHSFSTSNAGTSSQESGGERRAPQGQERWSDVQKKKCVRTSWRSNFSPAGKNRKLSG